MNQTRKRSARPRKEKGMTAVQKAEIRTTVEQDLRRLAPGLAAGTITLEALRALAPRVRTRVSRLLDALRRMEAGTYGVCAGCRLPISHARLSAIPETTVCVQCSWGRELSFQA